MFNSFVWLNLISIIILTLLILNNYKTNPNIIYLGIFLVIFSIFNIASYVTLIEYNSFWAGILFNHLTPMYLMAGPFLYFYTRGVLEDKFIFKKIDFLHFVLPFIQFVGILSYTFLLGFDDKVSMIEAVHKKPDSFATYRFNSVFTNAQSQWLRSISFVAYLIASFSRILFFVRSEKVSVIAILREEFNFRWLVYLLISVFFIPLLYVDFLFDVTHFDVGYILIDEKFTFSRGASILYISVIINLFNNISILFFPQLLYGIPKFSVNINENIKTETSEDVATFPPFKNREYFESLAEKIRTYLQEQEPFLQKEFTLQALSGALNVPQHHLTYCIRYFFNSNFSDLRNSYRIAHFKKLAEHGIPRHLTIDYLIEKSGFNSKSSFYSSFSKFEGYDPSKIIKQL